MKRIQRNVTQKYHTINEYDEQDKNNNDDGESESGSENKSENENDENVEGDDVEVGMQKEIIVSPKKFVKHTKVYTRGDERNLVF